MVRKPNHVESEKRVKELEKEVIAFKSKEKSLRIMDDAVASSINAIGITDLEGKIVFINDATVNMWGYNNKDEILGRYLPEFWEGEGVFETVRLLKEKGEAVGEDLGKRKDGSLFNVQFTASMFKNESGNPAYMFGSFFDITARKRAEEALRKAHDELEKRVEQRTSELSKTNRKLWQEIQQRKRLEKVAGHFGVETEDLKSGSKVPTISKARAVLCYVGVRKFGLTSVSIARELGISPSAVSKSIARAQQALWHEDIEEHLLESQ